jgi:hypothetical protein
LAPPRADDEVAPIPAVCGTTIEPQGSTLISHRW